MPAGSVATGVGATGTGGLGLLAIGTAVAVGSALLWRPRPERT